MISTGKMIRDGFVLITETTNPIGRPARTRHAIVHPQGVEIGTVQIPGYAPDFVDAFVEEFGAETVPSDYDLKTWSTR